MGVAMIKGRMTLFPIPKIFLHNKNIGIAIDVVQ